LTRLQFAENGKVTMLINGKCHCGNIELELLWNDEATALPARACQCSFCVKHGAVWTSGASAELIVRIRDQTQVSKYRFGTATARFLVCGNCGMVPVALCEIDGRLQAVVNINTLENVTPAALQRTATHFDAESVESRLARRKRTWIPKVHVMEGGKAEQQAVSGKSRRRESS
jgi:hypothetical protein